MEPIVNGLEAEYGDRVTFVRLDANQAANMALQRRYSMAGHPTFALIDGENQLAASFIGPQPAGALREAIERIASP